MITICLDEYGNFEMEDNAFVGGVIYEGEDYEKERVRISDYLKKICDECNAEYPKDLHYSYRADNKTIVKKVKYKVSESLENFLKGSKYHITCMMSNKNGRFDWKDRSNILNDDIASSRYEHMACCLLNDDIFNNIFLKDKCNDINLEIATRIAVVTLNEKEKIENFKKLGYTMKKENITYYSKPAVGFFATDEKTYRTFLSSLIMFKNKGKVNVNNINIVSTAYRTEKNNMEFLYLADLICDNLNDNIDFKKNDFGINNLYDYAQNLTGNRPMIYAYDPIDNIFNKAMDNLNSNNIFETLSCVYDGIHCESRFVEFYNKIWFKSILNIISDSAGSDFIKESINKLEDYMHSHDVIQEKAVFIFENIERIINGVLDKNKIKEEYKYLIAHTGIAVYNHIGDIKRTMEYYKKCEELKAYVDIEKFLDTVNRAAVIYADRFEFKKAYEMAEYNAECYKILKKAKKDIAELHCEDAESTYLSDGYGKSLSSCGQYLAFIKDAKAEEKFKEALREFEKEDRNRMTTISYLLHYAVTMGDQNLYERYSEKYFNSKNINEQFDNIINCSDKNINKNYAMYVYIRGIEKFYSIEIKESLLNKICTTDYSAKGFKINGHPWEIIFRYIGVLLYNKSQNRKAQNFIEKALSTVEVKSVTIDAINYNTRMIKYYYEDNFNKLEKEINKFVEFIKNKDIYNYFSDALIHDKVLEKYNDICNKFTYMYS